MIDASIVIEFCLNGSLNNKADAQYFSHDIYNTWMQTPLRENKYVSRAYAAFNETYGSYLGTMLVGIDGIKSDFAIASSRYGFIPMVLDSTNDLNDVIGNHFLEVIGSKNSPKNGLNFFGLSISWIGNDKFALQILFAPNEDLISGSTNPRMYIRAKNNGTWSGWNVVKGTLLS